jgi:Mn2+/Fe2+ NRAMP family transporter
VLTQVLNAVLLLPLLLFMYGLSRDPELMGGHRSSGARSVLCLATIALVATCSTALFALTVL